MRFPFLLAILLIAGGAGCAGPRPTIVGQQLRAPGEPGHPYVLTVTIRNGGGGEGQAEVIGRIHLRGQNETAAQVQDKVTLGPHETASISLELYPHAPGDYVPQVEVRYPPE